MRGINQKSGDWNEMGLNWDERDEKILLGLKHAGKRQEDIEPQNDATLNSVKSVEIRK